MTLSNYATEDSFNTYIMHLALKKHFTEEKYDYFKYNGKIRANFDNFRTRQDTYHYYRLSKLPNKQEIILAHVLNKSGTWVGDMKENEVFHAWKKIQNGLAYHFKEDLKQFKDEWVDNFSVSGSKNPFALELYMQKHISLETLTIAASIAKVYDYWNDNVLDKLVASGIVTKSRKYRPFLEIDQRFPALIKEKISQNH